MRKTLEYLINKTFNKLTIRELYSKEETSGKKLTWAICDCDCGTKNKHIRLESVKNGITQSCGCNKKGHRQYAEILEGERFENLIVKKTYIKKTKFQSSTWCECECECGNIVDFSATELRANRRKTCGKCDKKCENNCGERQTDNCRGFCQRCYDDFMVSKTNKNIEGIVQLLVEIVKKEREFDYED